MAVSEKIEDSLPYSVDKDTVNRLHDIIMEYGESGRGDRNFNQSDVPPMCPMYFNTTESLRYAYINMNTN